MTKIEELTIKAIEIANDQSISQDRKELAIKCLIQGEIDDVLKLTMLSSHRKLAPIFFTAGKTAFFKT
jgi:hypothetical protein